MPLDFDSGPLLKQVVSKIDKRTTMICLHAAGQTKPMDEPFDTLAGQQDHPPFHVHCRSVVNVWMPGFLEETRAKANAEMRSRPLKQRRLADGRKKSRIPSGQRGHGPGTPKADVGDWDQTRPSLRKVADATSEENVQRLLDGDGSLDDVPALLRRPFILENPERFAVTDNGGGLSETFWVTDRDTGRRYVLKRGSRNNGSVSDVVTSRLQGRMGLRYGATEFADDIDGHGWVLTEHVEDVHPGWKVDSIGKPHGKVPSLRRQLGDDNDPLDILLNDFMTDQTDRKAGNWLIVDDGLGKKRLVPIDNDGTFMGHRGLGKQDLSLLTRRQIETIDDYVDQTGTPGRGLRELARQIAGENPEATVSRYDELLDRARKIDFDDVVRDLRGVSPEIDKHLDEAKALFQARVKALEDNRRVILKSLNVPDGKIDDLVRAVAGVDAGDVARLDREVAAARKEVARLEGARPPEARPGGRFEQRLQKAKGKVDDLELRRAKALKVADVVDGKVDDVVEHVPVTTVDKPVKDAVDDAVKRKVDEPRVAALRKQLDEIEAEIGSKAERFDQATGWLNRFENDRLTPAEKRRIRDHFRGQNHPAWMENEEVRRALKPELDELAERRHRLTRELADALDERPLVEMIDVGPEDVARWEAAAGREPSLRRTLDGFQVDSKEWEKARDRYVVDDMQTLAKNADLRTGNPSAATKTWRRQMEKLIDSEETIDDVVLHRGAGLTSEQIDRLVPGSVLRNPGVVSTDVSNGTAAFYVNARRETTFGTHVVLFDVRVPKGTKMVNVGFGEHLLRPGSDFVVRSVKQDDSGVVRVVVELLDETRQKAELRKVVAGVEDIVGDAEVGRLARRPVADVLHDLDDPSLHRDRMPTVQANRERLIELLGDDGRVVVDGVNKWTGPGHSIEEVREGIATGDPKWRRFQEIVAAAPDNDVPLYRGMHWLDQEMVDAYTSLKVGDVVPGNHVVSFSSERWVAQSKLFGSDSGVMITVEPGSLPAFDVDKIANTRESEYLVAHDMVVKQVKVTTRPGDFEDMEEDVFVEIIVGKA